MKTIRSSTPSSSRVLKVTRRNDVGRPSEALVQVETVDLEVTIVVDIDQLVAAMLDEFGLAAYSLAAVPEVVATPGNDVVVRIDGARFNTEESREELSRQILRRVALLAHKDKMAADQEAKKKAHREAQIEAVADIVAAPSPATESDREIARAIVADPRVTVTL